MKKRKHHHHELFLVLFLSSLSLRKNFGAHCFHIPSCHSRQGVKDPTKTTTVVHAIPLDYGNILANAIGLIISGRLILSTVSALDKNNTLNESSILKAEDPSNKNVDFKKDTFEPIPPKIPPPSIIEKTTTTLDVDIKKDTFEPIPPETPPPSIVEKTTTTLDDGRNKLNSTRQKFPVKEGIYDNNTNITVEEKPAPPFFLKKKETSLSKKEITGLEKETMAGSLETTNTGTETILQNNYRKKEEIISKMTSKPTTIMRVSAKKEFLAVNATEEVEEATKLQRIVETKQKFSLFSGVLRCTDLAEATEEFSLKEATLLFTTTANPEQQKKKQQEEEDQMVKKTQVKEPSVAALKKDLQTSQEQTELLPIPDRTTEIEEGEKDLQDEHLVQQDKMATIMSDKMTESRANEGVKKKKVETSSHDVAKEKEEIKREKVLSSIKLPSGELNLQQTKDNDASKEVSSEEETQVTTIPKFEKTTMMPEVTEKEKALQEEQSKKEKLVLLSLFKDKKVTATAAVCFVLFLLLKNQEIISNLIQRGVQLVGEDNFFSSLYQAVTATKEKGAVAVKSLLSQTGKAVGINSQRGMLVLQSFISQTLNMFSQIGQILINNSKRGMLLLQKLLSKTLDLRYKINK